MTVDVAALEYINSLTRRAEDAEKLIEDLKSKHSIYTERMRQDLAEYERQANLIMEVTEPFAEQDSPIGDLAEKVQNHALTILKGRERPEWTFDRLMRERDEARDEIQMAKRYCDELAETISKFAAREIILESERDEARDEVARLRARLEAEAKDYTQDDVNKLTDEMIKVRREHEKDAFVAGAVSMREACAQYANSFCASGHDAAIRAIPIPEMK